jgi:hypothetical protein
MDSVPVVESGKNEVYVIPFMRPGSKWQIATGNGVAPVWTKSGDIYYVVPGGDLMAVRPDLSGATPAFSLRRIVVGISRNKERLSVYNATADGRRFLAYRAGEGSQNDNLSLISQWPGLTVKQ